MAFPLLSLEDKPKELGRLDIVLANAGISTPAPTLEMDERVWDEMIEINLTGQWKTIRAAVPHIIADGRGAAGPAGGCRPAGPRWAR